MESIEQSKPVEQRKTLFTCLACHVVFPTSEAQRNHYRTDWHKYNLKRKIAELEPITAEQFAEKILASRAKSREEQESSGLIYECAICKKSYYSENAFNNHIQSKKHREMEEQVENGDYKLESTIKKEPRHRSIQDPALDCMFCPETSDSFDANLLHMTSVHGFFLPDAEYLQDPKGLIGYLATKVNNAICLYCNGRGKEWKSLDAVRAHMVDVGHCKMAYDESEDPDELLKYYDFGELDESAHATLADNMNELVLENGTRVGHRRFLKQHKHVRKGVDDKKEEKNDDIASVASLPRRERRHRLAITDGNSVQQHETTAEGIKVASVKQNFEQHVSIKHNRNTLLRARAQVPI